MRWRATFSEGEVYEVEAPTRVAAAIEATRLWMQDRVPPATDDEPRRMRVQLTEPTMELLDETEPPHETGA